MAIIKLNNPITIDKYGLHFEKGEAQTDNAYIINKLAHKGFKIIGDKIENEEKKEKTIEEMTVAELKKLAAERQIEIPNNITKKAEIIEYINGKENKEEVEELENTI